MIDWDALPTEVFEYVLQLRKECARRRTENVQLREELAALRGA